MARIVKFLPDGVQLALAIFDTKFSGVPLKKLEDFSAKEIRKIEVYDDDQLLQTITKEDISEVTDYAWDGLFLNESNTIGLPDVRDLNFDGAEDFGLPSVHYRRHQTVEKPQFHVKRNWGFVFELEKSG